MSVLKPSALNVLPIELVHDIASYLVPMDIMALSYTNRQQCAFLARYIQSRYENLVLGDLMAPCPQHPSLCRRPSAVLGSKVDRLIQSQRGYLDFDSLVEYEEVLMTMIRYKSFAMAVKKLTIDVLYGPEMHCTITSRPSSDISKAADVSVRDVNPFEHWPVHRDTEVTYSQLSEMSRSLFINLHRRCLGFIPGLIKRAKDIFGVQSTEWWKDKSISVRFTTYQVRLLSQYIIALSKNVEHLCLDIKGPYDTMRFRASEVVPQTSLGHRSVYSDYLGKIKTIQIDTLKASDCWEARRLMFWFSTTTPVVSGIITMKKIKQSTWPRKDELERGVKPKFYFSNETYRMEYPEGSKRSWSSELDEFTYGSEFTIYQSN